MNTSTTHKPSLIGTWLLLSFELRFVDGAVHEPWGKDLFGQATYTSDGYMSGSFMRSGRATFVSGDVTAASAQECHGAMTSYVGYAGPYDYDAVSGNLTHHAVVSAFPNWAGTAIERSASFGDDGDHLTLSTPPIDYGGRSASAVLCWQRAPARN
jgi:Lipocalin-like domain